MARRRYPKGSTTARHPGTCARCGQPYRAGDQIAKVVPGWGHVTCRSVADPQPRTRPAERPRDRAVVDTDLHRRVSDLLGDREPYG